MTERGFPCTLVQGIYTSNQLLGLLSGTLVWRYVGLRRLIVDLIVRPSQEAPSCHQPRHGRDWESVCTAE
jgi:hypothetical protein